jgi:hypothetical protein
MRESDPTPPTPAEITAEYEELKREEQAVVTREAFNRAVTRCNEIRAELDQARKERDEAVALLDSALRTINAIATTAGYAYRSSNADRTAALDDIRSTAQTFKAYDGDKAETFFSRLISGGAR